MTNQNIKINGLTLLKAGSSKKGATLLSFQRKSLSLEGEGRVRVSLN
jgi:hypothetical protein